MNIPDENGITIQLSNSLEDFLGKMKKLKLKTWTRLLQIQLETFRVKFKIASVPTIPTKSTKDENIILFSPALDEEKFGKIKCPVCETLFKHKRSYETHHLRFHHDRDIDDTLTDPKGKCRLLSKITKRTCDKVVSYRGIYNHMKTKHSIERPSEQHKLGKGSIK